MKQRLQDKYIRIGEVAVELNKILMGIRTVGQPHQVTYDAEIQNQVFKLDEKLVDIIITRRLNDTFGESLNGIPHVREKVKKLDSIIEKFDGKNIFTVFDELRDNLNIELVNGGIKMQQGSTNLLLQFPNEILEHINKTRDEEIEELKTKLDRLEEERVRLITRQNGQLSPARAPAAESPR
jgi:hypothetical protein